MKILFLIRSLGRGGAERQLVLLANGLAKRGHSIHIATFYSGGERKSELSKSIALHSLNKKSRWDIVGFLRRYLSVCRAVKPDITYSIMPSSNVIAAFGRILLGSRLVWGIRTSKVPYELYPYRSTGQFIELLARLTCWLPDIVVCNSQAGRDWCTSQGFPASRTTVIPNGIDTDHFRPEPSVGMSFRMTNHIPPSAMVIGFAGRIDPIKNLESLIDAFGKISRDVGSFYLVIVGDGPQSYVDELKSQAQHAGVLTTVQFLPGAVIYEAIQAFDIGISCSLSEGFSNVIGELMSCEKPCVVTDVGDSAAIVGDTGLVVPPNSVAALHRGIMRLASENEHSMRERGRLARSRITNLFGLTQLVDRTEQTLKTVLTGEEPMCHSR